MAAATRGVADARVLRPAGSGAFEAAPHRGELLFGFVLEGAGTLQHAGAHPLAGGDAFVIPPDQPWGLSQPSRDLELLQVVLPASEAQA